LLAFVFFGENKSLHPGFYMGLLLILLAIVLQMIGVIRVQKKSKVGA
jgi:hypothetical protein